VRKRLEKLEKKLERVRGREKTTTEIKNKNFNTGM
jgi:hypothetical protein